MNPCFSWPVRVYYEDTDAGGIVYYANYLKFYERARTEWLRSLGLGQLFLKERYNILFVVRNVSVSYQKPAILDDALQVTVDISWLKRASFEFKQTVCRGDALLSQAMVTVACINAKTMRPMAIPDEVVQLMTTDACIEFNKKITK